MAQTTSFGFIGLQHLFDQRLDELGVGEVDKAVAKSLAFHNKQVNALLDAITKKTTEFKWSYRIGSTGTLQPLDEWGNPVPERPAAKYDVSAPLQRGGTAFGTNRESRALMTARELNDLVIDTTKKDLDWLKRHILAAIFTNTNWTYEDEWHGNLTITPLANGDAITYLTRNGTSITDNHYLAQAAGIADATNPFPAIYTELAEHESNTGPYIAYIPTNLVASVMALANFVESPDPDINYGANSVTLKGNPAGDPDTTIYGPNAGFGERYLGKVDGIHCREWASLPDNYIFAHAVGAGQFMVMREQPSEKLQGFFSEYDVQDGNRNLSKFIRIAGFAVQDRVAAVVQRIGNGTYAIPTNYTAPLPV